MASGSNNPIVPKAEAGKWKGRCAQALEVTSMIAGFCEPIVPGANIIGKVAELGANALKPSPEDEIAKLQTLIETLTVEQKDLKTFLVTKMEDLKQLSISPADEFRADFENVKNRTK